MSGKRGALQALLTKTRSWTGGTRTGEQSSEEPKNNQTDRQGQWKRRSEDNLEKWSGRGKKGREKDYLLHQEERGYKKRKREGAIGRKKRRINYYTGIRRAVKRGKLSSLKGRNRKESGGKVE